MESILLYGCETWGMNNTIIKEINRFKRRLVRRVLGVFWPKIMENVKVDITMNSHQVSYKEEKDGKCLAMFCE